MLETCIFRTVGEKRVSIISWHELAVMSRLPSVKGGKLFWVQEGAKKKGEKRECSWRQPCGYEGDSTGKRPVPLTNQGKALGT